MTTTFTVTQLARNLAQTLTQKFGLVRVEGEISGLMLSAQKHWYFSLKDSESQIRCVFFRFRNQFTSFLPSNGDKVVVYANIDWYAPRGDVQLNLESIQKTGAGQLHEQFLLLKNELAGLGWFDLSHKKKLPFFVSVIGVITSAEGAVVHDVITTLSRRAPFVRIIVYPCAVQGVLATSQIVKQIELANQRVTNDACQALIVCRGGGSFEDLAAYNSREVASAIFASALPVISAVGHESDITIADFVADVRAPTPTAAAELIVKNVDEWRGTLHFYGSRLSKKLQQKLEQQQQGLDFAQRRHKQLKNHFLQHLSRAQLRLLASSTVLKKRIENQHVGRYSFVMRKILNNTAAKRTHLDYLTQTLRINFFRRLSQHQQQLAIYQTVLHTIDVVRNLKKGYAILRDENDSVVKSVTEITPLTPYRVMLADGQVNVIGQ